MTVQLCESDWALLRHCQVAGIGHVVLGTDGALSAVVSAVMTAWTARLIAATLDDQARCTPCSQLSFTVWSVGRLLEQLEPAAQRVREDPELAGSRWPAMVWICRECAAKRGSFIPDGHIATWHPDICDVCGHEVSVTEPRDFWPRPDREPLNPPGAPVPGDAGSDACSGGAASGASGARPQPVGTALSGGMPDTKQRH